MNKIRSLVNGEISLYNPELEIDEDFTLIAGSYYEVVSIVEIKEDPDFVNIVFKNGKRADSLCKAAFDFMNVRVENK